MVFFFFKLLFTFIYVKGRMIETLVYSPDASSTGAGPVQSWEPELGAGLLEGAVLELLRAASGVYIRETEPFGCRSRTSIQAV